VSTEVYHPILARSLCITTGTQCPRIIHGDTTLRTLFKHGGNIRVFSGGQSYKETSKELKTKEGWLKLSGQRLVVSANEWSTVE